MFNSTSFSLTNLHRSHDWYSARIRCGEVRRFGNRRKTGSPSIWLAVVAVWSCLATGAVAQTSTSLSDDTPAVQSANETLIEGQWRRPNATHPRTVAAATSNNPSIEAHRVQTTRSAVPSRSGGKDMLPSDSGQVWRQYDISAYTSKVRDIDQPQQAIRDWILRETGTEAWFSQPPGLLNVDRSTVSVYHTPEMQDVVARVVGRFVNASLDPQLLNLRMVAVNSPNWRSSMSRILQPVDVQTVGVEAWLLSKENAAALLADLRRRSDFREHYATQLPFFNGQPAIVAQLRPRSYVRAYHARQNGWYGHEAEMAQLQEGFTLQISPLISAGAETIDAVVKCSIDQVEQLVSVPIDLPGMNGQIQRADIQVPQLVSWRLHDRFRWPTNQVLLLSCGVVASPGPSRATTFGIPNPFISRPGRSDALLFIESGGKASQAPIGGPDTTLSNRVTGSNGRY